MLSILELMEEITQTLSDTASSEVIAGKAIELGSAKIVPLSKVSLGFGGGGGEGDHRFGHGHGHGKRAKAADAGGNGKGSGGGAAGGAKVRPVGVVVFTDEGVTVETIPEKSGPLDKIFNKIPDLIDLAHKHRHRDNAH